MIKVVVGDVGGTNSRFKLLEFNDGSETVLRGNTLPSLEFQSFSDVLKAFLQNDSVELAVFAIAGLAEEDRAEFLNQGWVPKQVTSLQIQEEFNIQKVVFMNDFIAAELGCLVLSPLDFVQLNPEVQPRPHARIVVIGPGTGLGEALMTWQNDHYIAWPTEGGHSDFSPHNEEQWNYAKYMMNILQSTNEYSQFKPCESVSFELCCAGRGSYHLYEFFREQHPDLVSQEFEKIWEDDPENRLKNMMKFGFSGRDELCKQSVELWINILAYECGNLIAKNLPYGGIYVIGGIIAKNFEGFLQKKEIFMKALKTKPRHICEIIDRTPVFLVKSEDMGMNGVVLAAKRELKIL